MALQIVVEYKNKPVTYNVFTEEKNIYRLLLDEDTPAYKDSFIPNKVNIRRKGKIWVSDQEDDDALVHALMAEITNSVTINNNRI